MYYRESIVLNKNQHINLTTSQAQQSEREKE